MPDGEKRVVPNHAGSGIAHHRFNTFALFVMIAMNTALVADRFVGTKRALGNLLLRIRKKPGTIATQILPRPVMGVAINSNHSDNGPGFGIHALGYIRPNF